MHLPCSHWNKTFKTTAAELGFLSTDQSSTLTSEDLKLNPRVQNSIYIMTITTLFAPEVLCIIKHPLIICICNDFWYQNGEGVWGSVSFKSCVFFITAMRCIEHMVSSSLLWSAYGKGTLTWLYCCSANLPVPLPAMSLASTENRRVMVVVCSEDRALCLLVTPGLAKILHAQNYETWRRRMRRVRQKQNIYF